jgi:hypothetical protein
MRTRCNRVRGARRRTPSQLARAGSKEARIPKGSGPLSFLALPRLPQLNRDLPGRQVAAAPRPPRTATPAALAAGCSLTSCSEATPVLAGRSFSQHADVAQLAEHDLARVGATSSRLVIRSMSGVSAHKRRSAGVHVRGHAAGHVQRCDWCTGRGACGHSRHGSLQRMSRSSSGQGHRAFNSEITGSTPVRDARQEPSAQVRLEGGIGRNDWAAPEPVTGHVTGGVAQMEERLLCKQRVVGSKPAISTSSRGVWQRGRLRLPVKQFPRTRWFESINAHHSSSHPGPRSGLTCSVNSVARVPACLAGSRGFDSRTGRQVLFHHMPR